ncbi:MAG: sporulation protein [Candidatus Manganitrophaceae bacterium]|nr:MAG: sporulation protein [Candidatus Manganitrophaceae bacterium]
MSIAEDLMKTLLEQLKTIANTETIIGDAFQAGNVSIIPVSRISMGIGVGGGGQSQQGEGVGGGGGVKVEPIAFLVIKDHNVSLLNVGRGKGLDALYEKIPELIDKVVEKVSQKTARPEAEERVERPSPGAPGFTPGLQTP